MIIKHSVLNQHRRKRYERLALLKPNLIHLIPELDVNLMPTNSPGSDKAGPLRYTKHHVYNSADSLGKGATATVYLGRNQQTGEQVAIKAFTDQNNRHIVQARNREIELLTSLSHRNVMRILACEEEVISHNVVIIMPYCQEGSVQTLLDQPAHGFGFKEEEFLRFLSDITNGLEYLRTKGIVHRDIKPANIMKRIEEHGSSVYLLTDFGGARKLDEDETFVSICGTEEYIHPHMFLRGVLKQSGENQFNAAVDLWSLGITIYQVATGRLPFQALGGRNDSPMMFKIISERKSGEISGVQKQDGSIERSKYMPDTCYLSRGLRMLLEPMLAGIFETVESHIWKFDQYFQTVNTITDMKTLDVFYAVNGTNIKLYLRKTDCYRDIQEKIASLTDVPSDRQIILKSNTELRSVVEIHEQIQTYPKSVQNSQLFLFEKDNYDHGRLAVTNLPPFPSFSLDSSLSSDCFVAKQCAALSCYTEWKTVETIKLQKLLHDAKLNLRLYVQNSLSPLEKLTRDHEKMLVISKKRVDSITVSQNNITTFKSLVDVLLSTQTVKNFSKMVDIFCKDDGFVDDSIRKIDMRIEEINVYLSVLLQRLLEISSPVPADHLGCQEDDHCITKMEHVRVGVQTVMTTFSKHKKYGSLHPHEKFIHSVERRKMENFLVKIDSFHNHCTQNLKTVHISSMKRISMLLKHLTRRYKVETNMTCVSDCLNKLNEKLDKVDVNYQKVSEHFSCVIKELLKNPELIRKTEEEMTKLSSEKSSISSCTSSTAHSPCSSTHNSCNSAHKSMLIQQLLTQVTDLESSKSELTSILDTNTQSLRNLEQILSDTEFINPTEIQSGMNTTRCRSEQSDLNEGACGYS
ncbi:hypothetical protein ACF0H5_014208 [Mactra antiquata]